jgi:hypothetical protein
VSAPETRLREPHSGAGDLSAVTIPEKTQRGSVKLTARFATYADFMALAYPWVDEGSPDWRRGEIVWNAAREVRG